MTRTSLPPGFRFHPTDVELVKYYLKRKVLGKKFHVDAIAEVDIYKFAPWDLPDKACLRTKDLKWYFFCPRERKYTTGGRTNRSTEFGFWKTTGKDRSVIYNGQTVGMIKSLIFHRRGGEPKPERTDWVMHEYRLQDEDLKMKGLALDAFVICMIFQKDGRGPRNGAQYGAPYNEEEWDDDGETDVPPDKQKQTVDIRIAGSDKYCGGSTSKACPAGPSQIVPPPALPNDITMEDPQSPREEYLLSRGIFVDEIPAAASSENDKVEKLEHINPDGNHQVELTMDAIFDELDDLDNFAVTHSEASMLPPSVEFMELEDLDVPSPSVNGSCPAVHNYSDGYLSAYDHHSNDAQSYWTPVIPDDVNDAASGLRLNDLETPSTCFSEATQPNQAYVDASFYDLGGNVGLGGFGTSNPTVFAQPFHGSERTHIPWLSECHQLELFEGYVDNRREGYGVGECPNPEIVRYGAGTATSPMNNVDLGCALATGNSGRGEETIFCCMLQFLEYPAHPSSAVERPAPSTGAKRSDGHALFLLYGDSSFLVKAEVTLGGGGRGCTNDALSRGLEGFPVVTDSEENGSGSGKEAANCGCGILSSLVLLALSGYCGVLAARACIIGDFDDTFRLFLLDVAWLIEPIISVWCACIEPSVYSAILFVFYACSLPLGIHSIPAPHARAQFIKYKYHWFLK